LKPKARQNVLFAQLGEQGIYGSDVRLKEVAF
jgi:hypothetical protein